MVRGRTYGSMCFVGPRTGPFFVRGDPLTIASRAGMVVRTQPGEAPLSRLAGTTVPLGCLSLSGDR